MSGWVLTAVCCSGNRIEIRKGPFGSDCTDCTGLMRYHRSSSMIVFIHDS